MPCSITAVGYGCFPNFPWIKWRQSAKWYVLQHTVCAAAAGIMSAIDFYCTVDKLEGTQGERRVVITFNGEAGISRRV